MHKQTLALLLAALLASGCASTAAPAATGPAPVPTETAGMSVDLDGNGKPEQFSFIKSGNVITKMTVRSDDGATVLLELTDKDGSIVSAAAGMAGAATRVLLVGRAGGSGGHLMTGYLYDGAKKALLPLPWKSGHSAELGEFIQVQDPDALTIGVRDFARGTFVPTPLVYSDGKLGLGPRPKPFPVAENDWAPGTPERTVYTFYSFYMAEHDRGVNPLVSHSYRDHSSLAPELVERAGKAQGGDPFLCGQSLPGQIELQPAVIDGAKATVGLKTGPWAGDQPWRTHQVELKRSGDTWKMTNVKCQ